MKSKFANVVQEAQAELLEQQGGGQFNPDEVEGIMRWAAQGDPNTFKQFDGQQGEQYVGSMVNAYRQSQQGNPTTQPTQQANPNAQVDPNAQPQATTGTPATAPAPTTANAPTTV